jgi:NitT/TauT family transport system substrate-binding protein
MQKNPFAIASLPANPVNVPADLAGKKIGMALANTPVLQALCTLNNVDITQVEIVPTQYDAAPLLAGEVDCLLCWATDLPVAMAIQGIEAVTMLMADHGYAVHSQTYIATTESIATRRADIVAMLRGEARGWADYKADPAAAAALTVRMFPDLGLDLPTQELQAARQVPLMFSDLTDQYGFGWFTDETVAANIETLALLGGSCLIDDLEALCRLNRRCRAMPSAGTAKSTTGISKSGSGSATFACSPTKPSTSSAPSCSCH